MDTDNKTTKMHPLTAAAAIVLIIACLTGIAAMLGLLPNFNKSAPAPVVAANTIEAPTSASAVTAPPAPPAPPVVEKPVPAPKVVHKKPARRPANTEAKTTSAENHAYPTARASCRECGVVEAVRGIERQEPASGVGAGVGAVVGGLIGNQVGSGNGRTLATIAGAVGGGLAGNTIEKRRHVYTNYEVIVRMEDGERQRFIMKEQRWREGDLVRVEEGHLYSR